jgi:hypothetical protein
MPFLSDISVVTEINANGGKDKLGLSTERNGHDAKAI